MLALFAFGAAAAPTPDSPPDELIAGFVPHALQRAWGAPKFDVGSWVEYRIGARRNKADSYRLRLSVVPPALAGDRRWLEVKIIGTGGGLTMRLLTKGEPDRPGNIERLLVQDAGQAPLELPMMDLRREGDDAPAPEAPAKVTRAPGGKLTVPAGTFETTKLSAAHGAAAWYSKDAPIYGLVRAESSEQLVELVASGRTGAFAEIPVDDPQAPPPDAGMRLAP